MGGKSLLVSTVHNLWQNLVHSVKKTVPQSYSYNNRWPPEGRMTDHSCFCHELAKNMQHFGKKSTVDVKSNALDLVCSQFREIW